MSVEALITGKLHKPATERTGKSGKPFVTANVRAAVGEGESMFVNVVAFSESACAALLALKDGDAVALAGTLTPKVWTDREGVARPSLDLVAAQVMTLYWLKKKREASAPTKGASAAPAARHGPARGHAAGAGGARDGVPPWHDDGCFDAQDWPDEGL